MSYDLDQLKASLIRHEALRRKMYTCPAGKLTIGVGHNLEANPISERACHVILEDDIADVEAILDRNDKGWREHPEPVQRALVELVFNMGWGTWTGFRNTRRMLAERRYAEAARNLKLSKWYRQVGKRRGDYLANLIASAA